MLFEKIKGGQSSYDTMILIFILTDASRILRPSVVKRQRASSAKLPVKTHFQTQWVSFVGASLSRFRAPPERIFADTTVGGSRNIRLFAERRHDNNISRRRSHRKYRDVFDFRSLSSSPRFADVFFSRSQSSLVLPAAVTAGNVPVFARFSSTRPRVRHESGVINTVDSQISQN